MFSVDWNELASMYTYEAMKMPALILCTLKESIAEKKCDLEGFAPKSTAHGRRLECVVARNRLVSADTNLPSIVQN